MTENYKLIYKGNKASLPATREADSFYLCVDTHELYFGENLYTEAVRFYTGVKPTTPAQGVLYVNETTGAGDVWNGVAWKNVVKAYATSIAEGADDTTIPTSKAVKDYVDGEIDKIPAQVDYSVTVEESSPAGYAKAYTIKQKNATVATINVPKDMVVESGAVETKTEAGVWGAAGTYLVLTLANADEDTIYINVGDLIEYVTSGSGTDDAIQIAISADHKVTATVKDGSITLAMLAQSVQDEIAKAHTHANKTVLDGITSAKVTDWDDAAAKAHEHANKVELDKIATGDKAKWDAAYDALTVGTF